MRGDCQLQMPNVQSCVYESCSRGNVFLNAFVTKATQWCRKQLWTHPKTNARSTEGPHYLLLENLQNLSRKLLQIFSNIQPKLL